MQTTNRNEEQKKANSSRPSGLKQQMQITNNNISCRKVRGINISHEPNNYKSYNAGNIKL